MTLQEILASPVANAYVRGVTGNDGSATELPDAQKKEAEALATMFGDTPINRTVFALLRDGWTPGAPGVISFQSAVTLSHQAIIEGRDADLRMPDFSGLVPKPVRDRVRFALDTLNSVRRGIDEAAVLEKTVGGKGRYQADAYRNRQADIDRATAALSEFKRLAPENFVAADLFVLACGGEPDLTPSPDAKAWLDDPRGPVVQRPKMSG